MPKSNINAVGDFIIAAVVAAEEKAFIVEDSSPAQQHLEVLSVGDDVTACKVGDRILPYGQEFQSFKQGEDVLLVLRNDQIVGVFNV